MNLITFFFVSLGLSMDTLAVSLASGAAIKKLRLHYAVRFALFFGLFQPLMLFVGWLTGLAIADYVENYSHWIAFSLLTLVGCKMVYESTLMKEKLSSFSMGFWILFSLAFATSLDALTVGISFSLLQYRILIPLLILGAVTFSASFIGIYAGDKFGNRFRKELAVISGIILILIGLLNILQRL